MLVTFFKNKSREKNNSFLIHSWEEHKLSYTVQWLRKLRVHSLVQILNFFKNPWNSDPNYYGTSFLFLAPSVSAWLLAVLEMEDS